MNLTIEDKKAIIENQIRANGISTYDWVIAKRVADMSKDAERSEKATKALEKLAKEKDILDKILVEETTEPTKPA